LSFESDLSVPTILSGWNWHLSFSLLKMIRAIWK